MYLCQRLLTFALVLTFLGGCAPKGIPAFVNGGKTILVTDDDKVWTYDIASQKVTAYREHTITEARMLGDHVLLSHNTEEVKLDPNLREYVLFDTVTHEFKSDTSWDEFWNAIEASFDGRKALFVKSDAEAAIPGTIAYDLYTVPDYKKWKTISINEAMAVGNFNWIAVATDSGKLAQIDLFDPQGKRTASIPLEETQNLKFPMGRGSYAHLYEKDNVLLVGSGEQGSFTYGVFDVKQRVFLWGGVVGNALTGTPLIRQTEAWSLTKEQDKVHNQVRLVRHTPGDEPGEDRQEVVLTYAIPSPQQFGEYTVSPDGSYFAVMVHGSPPHLLLIPIKRNATADEVKVVELVEREVPSK